MSTTTHFDAVNKVWSGPKIEFHLDKHKNVGEILLDELKNSDPKQVMQIDGDTGEALTKGEICIRTIRCAQNLVKLGCHPNDRIGIVARNHHNLTPLVLGALCVGAAVSPLDVLLVKDGIAPILQRVRPSIIFCDSDVLESVNETVDNISLNAKLFSVDKKVNGFETIESLMTETNNEDEFVCTKLDDAFKQTAVIACSSGSTGLPKSICLTHAHLNFTFCMRKEEHGFVSLSYSSLYWFSGVWALMGSIFKHTRVFTSKPFSEDSFFDLVEKYKVQYFIGPPYQLQAILKSERCTKADLSSLLSCVIIGSGIPTSLLESAKRIISKCILLTGYAMTEMCTGATFTIPNELNEYPKSVGRCVPGVEIKIINETSDEKCGIDEEGEILLRGPIPPLGYYQDETATKNAFDADNFFITGDIGRFDESGRLYIVGRKKEIFKNRGFSVWPTEIEDIIFKNTAVRNACVVSVFDDEIMSDLPAAVIIKKDSIPITEGDIYSAVAEKLASYKRLDGGVFFVDEFPMTPSGKIIRSKVAKIAQNLYQAKKQQLKL